MRATYVWMFSIGQGSSTDCVFTSRVLFWACITPMMVKTTRWSIIPHVPQSEGGVGM